MKRFITLVLALSLTVSTSAAFAEVLVDLTKASLGHLPKNKIRVNYDPAYKKPRDYWAFPCKAVLGLYKGAEKLKGEDPLILRASDGYKNHIKVEVLRNKDCFIAFALGEEKWDKELAWESFSHGKETSNPAPFYLVWKNGDIRKDEDKPWPYALVSFESEDSQEEALTKPKDPTLNKGFALYKSHCLSCHSINLVGGEIGFEMNVPKNVTEYLSFEFFSSFARAPESYRAKSKMPAQALRLEEFKEIWAYLQGKAKEKIPY